MSFTNIIKEAIEDITSLEVATLHGNDIPLDSGIDQKVKAEIEKKITAQRETVNASRTAWLNEEDRSEGRKKKREFRAARRRLNELESELLAVSPADIFGKIQNALGQAATAGYSKYEVNGDSVNFLNSSLGDDGQFLLDAHKQNIETAQAARQRLIDTATQLTKMGKMAIS